MREAPQAAGGSPAAHVAARLPAITSSIVGVTAAGLLSVWLFVPGLKELSAVTMKANTALALLAGAAALWLRRPASESRGRWRPMLAAAFAATTAAVGVLTLLEYATGRDLGIDELLVTDFLNAESRRHPGRMSPLAALGMLLIGGALLVLGRRRPAAASTLATPLAISALLLAFLALVGYLYGVRGLYTLGPFIRIAWQTALCLILLAIGVVACRPHEGLARLLTSDGPAGLALRRLLPASIGIPVALGWIRLTGQRAGLYGTEAGTAMLVAAHVVVFSMIIHWSARAIARLEADRREAESSVRERERRLLVELEEAVLGRDEFLSVASHELKTPLTALRMRVDGMKRGIERGDPRSRSPERIAKLIIETDEQTRRLGRLIDDMLDVSRIRSGRLTIARESVDLGELVREVIERLAPSAISGGPLLRLDVRSRAVAAVDRLRVEQVVANLLTNAVRYGRGRPIHAEVAAENGSALISVRDEGIGIAPADQRRIFDPFERAIRSNEASGLGLGLFIARQIVAAHGGRIWVESEPDRGSTFFVELPLGQVEETAQTLYP